MVSCLYQGAIAGTIPALQAGGNEGVRHGMLVAVWPGLPRGLCAAMAGRTGRWHHALFNLTLHAILAPCFSRLVSPALQVDTLLNNTKFMAQESKFSMVPRAFLLNPLGFPASGFNPTPFESKDWTCKYNWKR